MKKTKKYLLTCDRDGDTMVWEMHADLTISATALYEADLQDTDKPVVDLRSFDGPRERG